METESPSFWADIKKYEDMLAKDPNSYCFAPLAELYRKLGMLDDAINIAKRGCEIHPEYVGGYMALGRAYFEKEMRAESRLALEKVVRVTPDNLLAQRLLSQIYIDLGETEAAEKALQIILFQNPADLESQVLLNSLTRIAGKAAEPLAEPVDEALQTGAGETVDVDDGLFPGEEEEALDLEEAVLIEELDGEPDEEGALVYPEQDAGNEPSFLVDQEERDPLTTTTLAELYVSQGFLKRALTIYRELLKTDPDNAELKQRLFELKEKIDQDEVNAKEHSLEPGAVEVAVYGPGETPGGADLPPLEGGGVFPFEDEPEAEPDRIGMDDQRPGSGGFAASAGLPPLEGGDVFLFEDEPGAEPEPVEAGIEEHVPEPGGVPVGADLPPLEGGGVFLFEEEPELEPETGGAGNDEHAPEPWGTPTGAELPPLAGGGVFLFEEEPKLEPETGGARSRGDATGAETSGIETAEVAAAFVAGFPSPEVEGGASTEANPMAGAVFPNGSGENAVDTLEKWLENIRRRR
jgi:tetratricopeptide (TPR) repeat protein